MRKCLLGVSVTTNALSEAKPRRQTIHDRSNDERAGHALRGVARIQPVAIRDIEAYQKMKV